MPVSYVSNQATSGSLLPGVGITFAKPTGTTSSDLLILAIDLQQDAFTKLTVPSGWTLISSAFTTFASNTGVAAWWAAGDVASTFFVMGSDPSPLEGRLGRGVMHRIADASLTTPIRNSAFAWSDTENADWPTPSVTAGYLDLIISDYVQPQSSTAVGTPSGFTSVYNESAPNRRQVAVKADSPAGATGTISHAASAAYQSRAGFTLAVRAAVEVEPPPSITRIATAVGTNTATMPAHQVGDLLVVMSYRDGNATAPTLASGFTNVTTASGSTNSARLAYKIAASTSEATGTWTNATSTIVAVYRGTHPTTPIGGFASSTGSSTSISYPALTMAVTDNTSWVAGFAGHRSANVAIETAPSGLTNVTSVSDTTDEAALHDSNGPRTSWSATSAAVGGTSSGWASITFELRLAPTTGTIVDLTAAINSNLAVTAEGRRSRKVASLVTSALAVDAQNKRRRNVAALINGSLSVDAAISRVLRLGALINEGYDVVADLKRQKRIGSFIDMVEALDAEIARGRHIASTVLQTLNEQAALIRMRKVAADIQQTLTLTAETTIATATFLTASISFSLETGASLTRNRGMSVLIDQLSTTTAELLRLRAITAGVAELSSLDARLSRTLKLIATLSTSQAVDVELRRMREMSVGIEQEFHFEETALLRLKALAAQISEATALEVDRLARRRGIAATVEQVETVSAALKRLREFGVAVVAEGALNADMKRLRGVIGEIAQTQGYGLASLKRMRGIAADIAQALTTSVTIRITSIEPRIDSITVEWMQDVHVGEGVFNRVPRTLTFQVTRAPDTIPIPLHSTTEIVIDVPSGEPLSDEVIQALIAGHQIPPAQSDWDGGASWDGGATWT